MNRLHSIRNKLLAVVLLATFSALSAASAIILMYDVNAWRNSSIADIRTQAELLGYSTLPALQFNDQRVALEYLELFRLQPTIQAAAIYNARGKLFASYSRGGETRRFPDLPGEEGVDRQQNSLQIFQRIVDNNEILGTAYITSDYQVTERAYDFMVVLTLVAVGALLVAALVCLWMQSLITRPILAITDVANEVVKRQDYSKRASKLSHDEVGVLVDAVNAMLNEIEGRTRALQASNLELEQQVEQRNEAREIILQLNEQLEAKVMERTHQLELTNAELESFCYSVSHDLRGPLRSISGFSQALIEELPAELPGESRRYYDKIIAATRRMGQLIEDLLNLSRVSRGELVRGTVNMSEMAWEIIRDLQQQEGASSVDISVWDGMVVEADAKLLRIVLENLLSNAWKFTSRVEQPVVVVGKMKDRDREVYFVRDNGAGFDMKYADKLFGAFQRLHGMNEFPGTGIGLATVQRIIHRHGGTIWFDAAPNTGATFYFTLKYDQDMAIAASN